MSWGKAVRSVLQYWGAGATLLVFIGLSIIAQSYKDNFCMRDPARSDAYAQKNAHEVAEMLRSLETAINNAQAHSTALNWAHLDGAVALGQTRGVFQSPMKEAVWWNPLSWVYLGPKLARYTPHECALLAEKRAEAQEVLNHLTKRYGGYRVIEPNTPNQDALVAAASDKGS